MIQFENVTEVFAPDFNALTNHLRKLEVEVPKAGGAMFNGWTVMGRNGKHTDGWVDGSAFMKKTIHGKVYFDAPAAAAAGFYPNAAHNRFTNASCPELERILLTAKSLGLKPCRARLIQLAPGATSNWHTDGTPEKLILRLHVVIESNPEAVFRTDQGSTNLKAGNVFLINVNYYHAVENHGDTSRTHLVVDVTDTKGISKVHV